jgi:hypothetical protein
VLYPHKETYNASPKAISGRTSYLWVRLAFHPYPQLIQALFNVPWFGPPRCVTIASPWSWIDHPVSGLQQQTYRPIQTRFRFGSVLFELNLACYHNSLAHSTKGTQSHVSIVLLLFVSIRFQVLFHSPPGVLFTFPSRYYTLSVTR